MVMRCRMNPKLLEDRPEDLVDRLNGLYPGGSRYGVVGQYKASPLEKEAAREIVRLREELKNKEMI
jgi:DNA helicase HerA-like ATPase